MDRNNNFLSSDEIDWAMLKLKVPLKGKAVSAKLAELINTSCTALCDTDPLTNEYYVPENCEMATSHLVNQEIWKIWTKHLI
jgi:hypothetical protein